MAAISSASGAAPALTPPSSSHGEDILPWGHSRQQSETMHDKNAAAQIEQTNRTSVIQNGTAAAASHSSSFDVAARRMHSVDNLYGARWDKIAENSVLSAPFTVESKIGRSTHNSTDDLVKRPVNQKSDSTILGNDNSKWIHRDKLAKIESEELQAAGIVFPRSRAPSKQRRDRSTRRDTDASEHSQKPKIDAASEHSQKPKNDSASEHSQKPKSDLALETREPSISHWDLRTAEEIAAEQENAYFISAAAKGGSRIPVAKISPAPIPVDFLERGVPAVRLLTDSPESETASQSKTRSRSASATLRDITPTTSATASLSVQTAPQAEKRATSDVSPKKTSAAGRKTSGPSKSSTATARPKTRPNHIKDSSSTTLAGLPTRSGELSSTKQPEGDPPWMINSYKPDPRLPPDQQIIPTVARRLQQEKWEREGKFGDIYDKEFRPLNNHSLIKPPGTESGPSEEVNKKQDQNENETQNQNQNQDQNQPSEWPLRVEVAKPPSLRQGSYSTMPKISDKAPGSPLSSPRPPRTPQSASPSQPQQKEKAPAPQRVPMVSDEDEKKGGCGCCAVM